jgi:hypothetical protein
MRIRIDDCSSKPNSFSGYWPRRMAREKLQYLSSSRRVVPVDATLRRALRTSDHRPGRNQIALQKVKMAMAVQGSTNHYLIDKIQRWHWIEQARQVGLGSEIAQDIIAELVEATDRVINAVDALVPSRFPDGLAESILSGLDRQRNKLAALPSRSPAPAGAIS